MKFRLICEQFKDYFEYAIQDFLAEGWTLHGPSFVDKHGNYCQSVTKEK